MAKLDKIDDEFYPVYLQIPAEKIVELKFLLESYEGIGELRTLDNDIALVVILGLKDTAAQIRKIIESEKENLKCLEVGQPDCISSDWLITTSND